MHFCIQALIYKHDNICLGWLPWRLFKDVRQAVSFFLSFSFCFFPLIPQWCTFKMGFEGHLSTPQHGPHTPQWDRLNLLLCMQAWLKTQSSLCLIFITFDDKCVAIHVSDNVMGIMSIPRTLINYMFQKDLKLQQPMFRNLYSYIGVVRYPCILTTLAISNGLIKNTCWN